MAVAAVDEQGAVADLVVPVEMLLQTPPLAVKFDLVVLRRHLMMHYLLLLLLLPLPEEDQCLPDVLQDSLFDLDSSYIYVQTFCVWTEIPFHTMDMG